MHDPRKSPVERQSESAESKLDPTQSVEATSADDFSEDAPDTTSFVPTFEQPARPAAKSAPPGFPAAGEHLEDFELLEVLGKGAFATVYLARQTSLGRQVALKVSANRGTEARTLASLEHDHIVHVFSETVLAQRNLRLLCMQYVNGATLEQVLRALSHRPRESWSGAAILEVIDMLATQPALFDPAALRDRELLGQCDYVEAICWIGARLAEALAHAHSQGVLHRDIKPANILINRYGRPMLADFNVSLDPERIQGARGEVFGGTLAYMAPEHVNAFNPGHPATPEDVNEPSDQFSLGVVLFEALTGKLPCDLSKVEGGPLAAIATLTEARKQPPRLQRSDVPEMLDWTVRRCLAPEPDQRFENPSALANALDGCREHIDMMEELPEPDRITRAMLKRPFLMGVTFMLLPHLLGSIVNISYNAIRIMGTLDARQQTVFNQLVLGYNVLVYPVCIYVLYRVLAPIYRTWRSLDDAAIPDEQEVERARRGALRLPFWAIGLACVGWLPGGVLFPIGIGLFAGPLPMHAFGHFVVSFSISGLIALAYSLFAVEFWSLRVLYPRLWVNAHQLRATAGSELVAMHGQLRIFEWLAGMIPLAGAVLLIMATPSQFQPSAYAAFRLLVLVLIFLGGFGFSAALAVSRVLQETLTTLEGSHKHRHGRLHESRQRTHDTLEFQESKSTTSTGRRGSSAQ